MIISALRGEAVDGGSSCHSLTFRLMVCMVRELDRYGVIIGQVGDRPLFDGVMVDRRHEEKINVLMG
jgi:hypothetical protein